MPGRRLGRSSDARRILAELRREERRRAELPHDERLHLLGIRQRAGADRAARPTSGNRTTKPSSPHSVSTSMPVSSRILAATAIAHGAWMRPPRGERTHTRQSPRSSRHALDDDRGSVGTARGPPRPDRAGIAGGFRRRARRGRARASADRSRRRAARAAGRASASDREPELERPSGAVALPERHLAGLAGAGDTSTRSCVISSMRQVEAPSTNVSPDAALEHHLLVELADARRPVRRRRGTRRTVRDRESCRRSRSPPASRPRAPVIVPCDAVPGDARPQLGEFVGGIAAGQHVEHAVEDASGSGQRTAPRCGRGEQLVDVPRVHRRHRDDLLRERRRADCADSGWLRPRRRASLA